MCLLLRAARAAASSLLRIRCARPGLSAALVAANSAATEILLAQAFGWAAKFLCIILVALIATRLDLLTEVFRTLSGRRAFGDPPSQETQPQMRAGYGS
jgi:predicted MFS family arabinose efflux permease